MADRGPFSFEFLETLGVPLRDLRAGETLFLADDEGRHMYVVVEGRIDVKVGGMIVEHVGPNSVVGEMALIDLGPRSATAVARVDTKLAEIGRDDFLSLVSEYPSFALYVMKLMAGRIRRMNAES
jgi:CRP-like cAMP-binding protein